MNRPLLRLACLLSFAFGSTATAQGSCGNGTAQATLDVNNVAACMRTNGSFFRCGSGVQGYEVPQGGGIGSVFQSGIWLGGLSDGLTRFAGSTYGPSDFWPGPLSETGNAPSDCSVYDRIYKVDVADIEAYDGGASPTPDLAEWPADLGAPVVDGDGVLGNYDLAAGDRPDLNGGDQTLWWVINDQGNLPAYSQDTPAPGVEIRIQAWAHDAPDQSHLDNTTFYRFTVLYRGDQPLDDTLLGLWMDLDVGGGGDDFIGSDPGRDLAFAYNGDSGDEGGYGNRPAAIGATFLKGLTGADGTDTGAGSVVYYTNDSGPTGNPRSGSRGTDGYGYMNATWVDGFPFTVGGNGRGGTTETNYVYTGTPPSGWSEPSAGNTPGDRLVILSTGPGTLQPDSVHEVEFALVWARAASPGATAHYDAVTALLGEVDQVQAFISVPTETGPASDPSLALAATSRNPTSGRAAFRLTLREAQHVTVDVLDVLGRRVRVLREGTLAAGDHVLQVGGADLAPGTYIVRARGATGMVSLPFTVAR